MLKYEMRLFFVLVFCAVLRATYASAILKIVKEYKTNPTTNMSNFLKTKEWHQFSKTIVKSSLEDAELNFIDIVKKYEYPVEDHYVTTRDGYILNIHRIPHGKDGPPRKQRGVVFLQHGILSSSYDWIIAGPSKAFAYLLAEAGYDVWMGNARGNLLSKNHTTLSIHEREFWNFSWHEIGVIDVPTMIDYVLDYTRVKKVLYVGHSQGTTAFFVMTSELPRYNAKIRAQFSLAPVAYMDHMWSPFLRLIARAEGSLELITNLIGWYEFLPSEGFIHQFTQIFCADGILEALCGNALFAICGFNKKQFNATLLPILMGHTPGGCSTKQILHYAQLIRSGGIFSKGRFGQWDFGFFGNRAHYGQSRPPNYNLSHITAPVYLFYSSNDWLSSEKDVLRLYYELPNARGRFLNPDKNWNHMDYIYGIDANRLVYQKVMSVMLSH